MTNKDIQSFIDRLNNLEYHDTIFLRRIHEFVYVARVWDKHPELDDYISVESPSHDFFFIKNNQGEFIGAVFDMGRDLHWYVVKEHRKKGHLTKALREAILPYLFYEEEYPREHQRITIDADVIGEKNYNDSKMVALSLGFKQVGENEFILLKEEFDWGFDKCEEENGGISKERFEELRKQLNLSYRILMKVSDELLMAYGEDRELREHAIELRYFHSKLEDIEWGYIN